MNKTGGIIAELRKEAGYTQKSLAAALHITDKAVSKWERGLCCPDSALLPKLSLLLDADIELLLSDQIVQSPTEWVGVLDLTKSTMDLRKMIFDKPLAHYVLSHFLLLGINEIYVYTRDTNEHFLEDAAFRTLGFRFHFNPASIPLKNLMIINKPFFLFGSDLTRKYQSAMVSNSVIKLAPERMTAPVLFCPAEYSILYNKNPAHLFHIAVNKSLGRGMVYSELKNENDFLDVANFVRFYQSNTGLQICSLEEIAHRKGFIH